MFFPISSSEYQIPGFELRILTEADKPQMMAMQDEVLALLADQSWYFPSEEWEFDSWLAGREAVAYMDGDVIAGYAVISPWHIRAQHAYAGILGHDVENTYDFHDVMVRPQYRGKGMHTHFLKLFADTVRAEKGRAIYCTVDPGNRASWHNFEKAGYECLLTQPAYDGRSRRYYRLSL